jgi:excisionase family DNA binding protein
MIPKKNETWLKLTDVARILGVHQSTVRLWSDKGILPTHRTSGGHRRYLKSEIELWQNTTRERHELEPASAMQIAIGQVRMQIADGRLEAEPWYQKLDEAARIQYRTSSMALVRGMMNYISSNDSQALHHESHAIGYEYASRARRYGLNAVDATRAFLFFRNTLLEAMVNAYDDAHVPPGMAWGKMLGKLHDFTDQVLINLLQTYQAFEEARSKID